jgi:hypothetical protein
MDVTRVNPLHKICCNIQNKTEKSFSHLAAIQFFFPDLTNQQQHYNSDFCKVVLKGCVIVALQGCVIVVSQGCVIVALQGCVILGLQCCVIVVLQGCMIVALEVA